MPIFIGSSVDRRDATVHAVTMQTRKPRGLPRTRGSIESPSAGMSAAIDVENVTSDGRGVGPYA